MMISDSHALFEAAGCAMTLNNTGVITDSKDFVSTAFAISRYLPFLYLRSGGIWFEFHFSFEKWAHGHMQ